MDECCVEKKNELYFNDKLIISSGAQLKTIFMAKLAVPKNITVST